MTKGCNTRGLLLLGLGLISLIVVGLLFYGQPDRKAVSSSDPNLPGLETTARQALAPATELASQWQADAQLTIASCHWRVAEKGEWAFQFFSSSTRRLALITVIDGAAHMKRERLSPYSVPTFSSEEWQVDSERAFKTWWDGGGSVWVARRPDIDLVMQLQVPNEGGEHPVWTVAGFVADTEDIFITTVDAIDGTVIK